MSWSPRVALDQDLYFRLKVVQKTVKPLRQSASAMSRCWSLNLLMRPTRDNLPAVSISAEAREALKRYAWPGNAREMRNVIEGAMLYADGVIDLGCLPPEVLGSSSGSRGNPILEPGTETLSAVKDYERQLIVGLLSKYRKINQVAKALGVARSTLYRKFAELQIDQNKFTQGAGDETLL